MKQARLLGRIDRPKFAKIMPVEPPGASEDEADAHRHGSELIFPPGMTLADVERTVLRQDGTVVLEPARPGKSADGLPAPSATGEPRLLKSWSRLAMSVSCLRCRTS